MLALFSHDTRFIKTDKNRLYTNGSFCDSVWKRYLDVFGELRVVSRARSEIYTESDCLKNYNYFDTSVASYIEAPDILRNIRLIGQCRETVKRQVAECDVLIARLPSVVSLFAVQSARKLGKPYIIELVGCPWDAFRNHSAKGMIIAPLMWAFTRSAVKKAPYVLYVSERFLQKRYPTKGKTLYCSDAAIGQTDSAITERRKQKINKTEGTLVLGTVAALDVKYKGQQYVIEAISRLKNEGLDFRYRLVGQGNSDFLVKTAEKFGVADRLEILGTLPHDKIFGYMDDIDIYIQPSLQEGLPRVIIEAMSRACPVLGAKTGGIPELVNTELVFERKNVADTCAKLKKIADKTALLREAERSFNKAREFEEKTLNDKRNAFYMSFRDEAGGAND